MGCCVRTGVHLTLDLPLMFWKQLVGQEVKAADIKQVDLAFYSYIKSLKECS